MKYPPQLTEKHFLAMIGLSEAKVWDEIIKTDVPFSLSDAERSFLIEEEITEFRWSDALDKAEAFFRDKNPSGKIYFKKNRTSSYGKLYVTNWGDDLGKVVGYFEPKADKQKEEMMKRMFG